MRGLHALWLAERSDLWKDRKDCGFLDDTSTRIIHDRSVFSLMDGKGMQTGDFRGVNIMPVESMQCFRLSTYFRSRDRYRHALHAWSV